MKKILLLVFIVSSLQLFSQEIIHYEVLTSNIKLNIIKNNTEDEILNIQADEYITVIQKLVSNELIDLINPLITDYAKSIIGTEKLKLYLSEIVVNGNEYSFISMDEMNINESTEIQVKPLNYIQSSNKLILFITQANKENNSLNLESKQKHQINATLVKLYYDSIEMKSDKHIQISTQMITKYLEDELPFIINKRVDSYISSARFKYKDNGNYPHIELNENIFDLYENHSSLFQGIIFHELFHAYILFTNKDYFLSVRDDIIEQYMYEMDALNIEATYFTYLSKNYDLVMTPFEQYMINSFSKDNLGGVSYLLKTKDMDLIYYLSNLSNSYLRQEIDISYVLDEVIQIGNYVSALDIIGAEGWKKYTSVCTQLTYSQHIAYFLNPILSNIKDDSFDEKINEINTIKNNIDKDFEVSKKYIQEKNTEYILNFEPVIE